MNAKRVAVIGAGLGGIAAAIRLAVRGLEVHLFEREDHAGGKANSMSFRGYRFDTGPSLFTMRGVFEELFAVAGSSLGEWLTLRPLDPVCRYFYPDGTRLSAWADPKRFAFEAAEKTEDSAEAVIAFMDHCRRIYESAGELFLGHSLHEVSTYLRPQTLHALLSPWRIDPLRTMHQANEQAFHDAKLVQLFDRYATYNGSDPYRAPATLNIIAYVEHCMGAFGVEGGIYSIVDALTRLAEECGVIFHFSTEVKQINLLGRRVRGIRVEGENLPFEIVVSNSDVAQLYRMLPKGAGIRRRIRTEASTSAVIFLWGMKSHFEEVDLHNVFFSRDYREEFRDIFGRDRSPVDPTVYLHVSSKVTPSDAPTGGENWFVLVNSPPDSGQNWQREVERLRPVVLRRIGSAIGKAVEDSIVAERWFVPTDIAAATASHRGSLYGAASNSRMSAFSRHPNRVPGLRGLYACGGSTHPGGGMPLVLQSAKITTDLIARHEL